jgi:hypothetical protein
LFCVAAFCSVFFLFIHGILNCSVFFLFIHEILNCSVCFLYSFHHQQLEQYIKLVCEEGLNSSKAFSKIEGQAQKGKQKKITEFATLQTPRLAQELCLLLHYIMKGLSFASADCPYFKKYHESQNWHLPPNRKRLRYTFFILKEEHLHMHAHSLLYFDPLHYY